MDRSVGVGLAPCEGCLEEAGAMRWHRPGVMYVHIVCRYLAIAICFSVVASMAHATPLNLTLNPAGDITSGYIDVMYTAGSNQFAASGFALAFNNGSIPAPGV